MGGHLFLASRVFHDAGRPVAGASFAPGRGCRCGCAHSPSLPFQDESDPTKGPGFLLMHRSPCSALRPALLFQTEAPLVLPWSQSNPTSRSPRPRIFRLQSAPHTYTHPSPGRATTISFAHCISSCIIFLHITDYPAIRLCDSFRIGSCSRLLLRIHCY